MTLAAACQRALIASARRAGTRQQLRAAARRFVHRHRRDAAYLRWVLRSVGASSALAVALLGLAPGAAHARAPIFSALTGSANPLDGKDAGTFSTPAAGDLDGDGDLDLLAGSRLGVLAYFENTGSATSPAYAEQTGAANPLDGEDVGSFSAPALADLDADGDLDLAVGEAGGGFFWFENTGSGTSPAFVQRTGGENPLDALDAAAYAVPAFGDLDSDGDLDLAAGNYTGAFRYFENTGSATAPAFTERTGTANPLDGRDVGSYSAPALGDVDRDGDLDLVAGEYGGEFRYFDNTRGATNPGFFQRIGNANPFAGEATDGAAAPVLADIDADGDLDVVSGNGSGTFASLANLAGVFLERTGALDPLDGVTVAGALPRYLAPVLADVDGDGDLDLVSGTADITSLRYFQNSGTSLAPAYPAVAVPLPGITVLLGRAAPAFGNLDGDADQDLVIGNVNGTFQYYQNTGLTPLTPAFALRTGASNPLNGVSVGFRSKPALADFDGDGDLDMLSAGASSAAVGAPFSFFHYFENTGTIAAPAFVELTGGANPFSGVSGGPPSVRDVDEDGDVDIVAGAAAGSGFIYFENLGTRTSPNFFARTGAENPYDGQNAPGNLEPTIALGDLDGDGDPDGLAGSNLATFGFLENATVRATRKAVELTGTANLFSGINAGLNAATTLGDVDGDGDIDLVTGGSYGLGYFENTGNAATARFVQRTGGQNPLDGIATGALHAPCFVDLEGDGDLDLVSANGSLGVFFVLENTGSATSPAFVLLTGSASPLDGIVTAMFAKPTLADFDGDGDSDLAFSGNGTYTFLANTGDATRPAFLEQTGSASPLSGLIFTIVSALAAGDVDADGDLDLFAGELSGSFPYLENAGSATSPAFLLLASELNPMDGFEVVTRSTPALGDLDADGDLDVVAGDVDGGLHVYYMPEPAQGAMLGAAFALLGWLRRRRVR